MPWRERRLAGILSPGGTRQPGDRCAPWMKWCPVASAGGNLENRGESPPGRPSGGIHAGTDDEARRRPPASCDCHAGGRGVLAAPAPALGAVSCAFAGSTATVSMSAAGDSAAIAVGTGANAGKIIVGVTACGAATVANTPVAMAPKAPPTPCTAKTSSRVATIFQGSSSSGMKVGIGAIGPSPETCDRTPSNGNPPQIPRTCIANVVSGRHGTAERG